MRFARKELAQRHRPGQRQVGYPVMTAQAGRLGRLALRTCPSLERPERAAAGLVLVSRP